MVDLCVVVDVAIGVSRFERQRRVRAGRSASLRRSAGTPTALRCSVLRPRRRTRYAHFVRLRSNSGDESVLERAARGATSLPLLAAEEAPSELPGHAFAETFQFFDGQAKTLAPTEPAFALPAKTANGGRARQAVPGWGDFWGGEERSIRVGARSALQHLTRRVCLNEVERSERSELCGATLRRAPQRSRRTRRPPQHEPRPGAACRDPLDSTPILTKKRRPQWTAVDRFARGASRAQNRSISWLLCRSSPTAPQTSCRGGAPPQRCCARPRE